MQFITKYFKNLKKKIDELIKFLSQFETPVKIIKSAPEKKDAGKSSSEQSSKDNIKKVFIFGLPKSGKSTLLASIIKYIDSGSESTLRRDPLNNAQSVALMRKLIQSFYSNKFPPPSDKNCINLILSYEKYKKEKVKVKRKVEVKNSQQKPKPMNKIVKAINDLQIFDTVQKEYKPEFKEVEEEIEKEYLANYKFDFCEVSGEELKKFDFVETSGSSLDIKIKNFFESSDCLIITAPVKGSSLKDLEFLRDYIEYLIRTGYKKPILFIFTKIDLIDSKSHKEIEKSKNLYRGIEKLLNSHFKNSIKYSKFTVGSVKENITKNRDTGRVKKSYTIEENQSDRYIPEILNFLEKLY